jgi:hypothetical protein
MSFISLSTEDVRQDKADLWFAYAARVPVNGHTTDTEEFFGM